MFMCVIGIQELYCNIRMRIFQLTIRHVIVIRIQLTAPPAETCYYTNLNVVTNIKCSLNTSALCGNTVAETPQNVFV